MEEKQFEGELAKYPIIRHKHWRGWEQQTDKNKNNVQASSGLSPSTHESTSTPTPTSTDTQSSVSSSSSSTTDFWSLLYSFLVSSYVVPAFSSADALRVVHHVKKIHYSLIKQLSLDDIEQICRQIDGTHTDQLDNKEEKQQRYTSNTAPVHVDAMSVD